MSGCTRGVQRGVQATISQGDQHWNACSLNVWHSYNDYGNEGSVLHFVDAQGKAHELAGQYRVDYSKVPCFN